MVCEDLDDKPWLAEGQTVYQWIAARPELHSLDHWEIEPRFYRPHGDPDAYEGCGIYFLMNAEGRCFYIGQSTNFAVRLLAHWRAGKVPFTHVWTIAAPRGALNELEAFLIWLNDPPHNERFCYRMKAWATTMHATLYPDCGSEKEQ